MTKHWRISIGVVAVLAVITYGLWNQASVRHFLARDGLQVKVVAAKKILSPAVIETIGQLQPTRQTDVISVVPGVVTDIRAIGERVKTGEVVAVVESKSTTARLRANETAVKAAAAKLLELKGRLAETEKKLAVVQEAYSKELIARRDLEIVEAAAEAAQVENERAQAQLAQSEAAAAQTRYLSKLTRVVAPVSGTVASRTAERGASVPAYARIMTLADTSTMRVVIPLAAGDARLVHAGLAVKVTVPALPQRTFEGRVLRVTTAMEAEGDPSTAEVEVQNTDGTLKPALEASVFMPVARERITVPSAAVFDLRGIPCLYVIADQKAVLRRVTTGLRESTDVVVTSNLAEGEKVVVNGHDKLRPGNSVRVSEQ